MNPVLPESGLRGFLGGVEDTENHRGAERLRIFGIFGTVEKTDALAHFNKRVVRNSQNLCDRGILRRIPVEQSVRKRTQRPHGAGMRVRTAGSPERGRDASSVPGGFLHRDGRLPDLMFGNRVQLASRKLRVRHDREFGNGDFVRQRLLSRGDAFRARPLSLRSRPTDFPLAEIVKRKWPPRLENGAAFAILGGHFPLACIWSRFFLYNHTLLGLERRGTDCRSDPRRPTRAERFGTRIE